MDESGQAPLKRIAS